MKNTSSVLAARLVLIIALVIGFYALAIAIAAILIYIPYAEWTVANRIHIRLAFFCLAGAAIILWSIFPRIDRFAPSGPQLRADRQPRLFRELQGIANATEQEMPEEVYLVSDVNAWVSQRGGIVGIGSRRVMGVGLPLLQVLTVSEFHAVLAHEFGHFYGGDTNLGPLIYKIRSAISRTLQGLSEHSSILELPFRIYPKNNPWGFATTRTFGRLACRSRCRLRMFYRST